MNCREAEQQIFAERDGALAEPQRAALVTHVAQCATCRQMRESIAQAIDSWRASAQDVRVPDADLEWQKVRRVIRGGAGSTARSPGWRLGWLALPVTAAAAIALALWVDPANESSPRDAAQVPQIARATVEASVENASPVVFVDDKSGWVFVWAETDNSKHI